MGSILVIGSIMMDFILKIDRMPQEGESMLGNGIQIINGGKGANQAVAIARQEMDTYFCGKVGEDDSGRKISTDASENRDSYELCIDLCRYSYGNCINFIGEKRSKPHYCESGYKYETDRRGC